MTSAGAGILVKRDGPVAQITLCRPTVLNALDRSTAAELRDAVKDVAIDTTVRAVVLTGAGRAFSAGADLSDALPAATEHLLRRVVAPLITTLRSMPKPVIAAVNGPAAGIGCSIALASDLVFAAKSAYFLLAFAKVGLTLDGGASVLVPARIGMGRALYMALLTDRVPAAMAVDIGLADRVVADTDLVAETYAAARQLAAGPTLAYAAIKNAVNATTLAGLAEALDTEAVAQARLVQSTDHSEAVKAFDSGEPPVFIGR